MTDCQTLHRQVLNFLERCAPSSGIFDIAAWEAAGRPPVASFSEGITPKAQRKELRKSLEQRIADNDWAYASTPGGVESLEASHSAAATLYYWGDLAKLPNCARQSWVNYLTKDQDQGTGYFLGPYVREAEHASWSDTEHVSHPWAHMHDHMTVCLSSTLFMLGGKPKYKLSTGSQTGRFLDRTYLRNYLNGRHWCNYRRDLNFRDHNPWYLGNEYWYPGAILQLIWTLEAGTPAAEQARSLLEEEWYGWHDANLSPWGFWYGDLQGDPQKLFTDALAGQSIPSDGMPQNVNEWAWHSNQVMGGAHQMWLYDFDRHPIDDSIRQRQTDLLLAMQNHNDDHWGLGDPSSNQSHSNDCTDVDCLSLLSYNYFRQDYRRADIQIACDKAASAIIRNKVAADGVLQAKASQAWSHHHGSYETLSPGDAGNVHQQSFYLWALICAVTVLDKSDDPAVQSFIDRPWPTMPCNWLWAPSRHHYQGHEPVDFYDHSQRHARVFSQGALV